MPRRKQDRPKRMNCEDGTIGSKLSDFQSLPYEDGQPLNKSVKKYRVKNCHLIKNSDKTALDNMSEDEKDFEISEENNNDKENENNEDDDDDEDDKDDNEEDDEDDEDDEDGEDDENDEDDEDNEDNDDNEDDEKNEEDKDKIQLENKFNDIDKVNIENQSIDEKKTLSPKVNRAIISKEVNHFQKCKEKLNQVQSSEDLSKMTDSKLTLATTHPFSPHLLSSFLTQTHKSSSPIKLKSSSSSSLGAIHKSKNVNKLTKSKKSANDLDEGTPLDFSLKNNKKANKEIGLNKKSSSDKFEVAFATTKEDSPLDLSLKFYSSHPAPSIHPTLLTSKHHSNFDSNNIRNFPISRSLTSFKPLITQAWNGSKLKSSNNFLTTSTKSSLQSSLSFTSSSFSSSSSPSSLMQRASTTGHGRQNPWQTQWMSRSSEQNRDVFTCVWCKNSFRSLQEMTEHMKASPRCGMAGMQQAAALVNSSSSSSSSSSSNSSSTPSLSNSLNVNSSHQSSLRSSSISPGLNTRNSPPALSNQSSNTIKEPMSSSVLAKNSMNLPRKLVRGQDVWLGRGAEQTRQILKCMWCGQSFKTLDDMTRHMRETQHYTNIISQEQIISWKTPEDKLAQSQVNAVLTCKVCDESFGSLKELSNHIVRNAHYKEHIIRSMTEGGHGRRRQTRERRKKSLPVRKLLELERMELVKETLNEKSLDKKLIKEMTNRNESKHSRNATNEDYSKFFLESSVKSNSSNSSMITCDECNERVDAKNFIAHIKNCKSLLSVSRTQTISEIKSPSSLITTSVTGSRPNSSEPPSRDQTQSPEEVSTEEVETTEINLKEKKEDDNSNEKHPSSFPSVEGGSFLSSIEKLIEKSFDTKSRKNQTTGILQRLGIDEEICPPWQSLSTAHSSNNFNAWMSFKDSSHGHLPVSPTPSGTSSSLIKENGSIDSPSSCDDSNSSVNLLRSNMSLPTASNQASLKFSFPISSMIVQNEESDRDRKRTSLSPNSLHSGSNSATPCSSHGTPPPQPPGYLSLGLSEKSKRIKRDSFSELSEDDERDKSPKKCEKNNDLEKSKSQKHNLSEQSLELGESILNQSLNNIKSASKALSTSYKKRENSNSSFHPLLELQKLLDKTNSSAKKLSNNTLPSMISNLAASSSNSLRSFNWALNENTSNFSQSFFDSGNGGSLINSHSLSSSSTQLLKCAFCETQFVSKGAYRHHLSKIHFINTSNKDSNNHKEFNNINNNNSSEKINKNLIEVSGTSNDGQLLITNNSSTLKPGPESPHSKFLKYTELAKQLSSKYV